jgi:hypothetical protein
MLQKTAQMYYFFETVHILFRFLKFLIKKYFYTINHKRLGMNYFYLTLVSGLSGAILATAIRIEMAYPGSPFFSGDSLRYLQVITAHALIMVFFVVVPIFFGGFANFLLPYHVGSKDVAFPRLNSLGFWIQPCGYILIAKIGFIRSEYWNNNDKIANYSNLQQSTNFTNSYSYSDILSAEYYNITDYSKLIDNVSDSEIFLNLSSKITPTNSWKLLYWRELYLMPESFWFLTTNATSLKRRKRHVVKCSNATQTVSGWTFITPFSSKLQFTGAGIQDMLIIGVYYAGISTTISLTNLLVTRRTLTMPGIKKSTYFTTIYYNYNIIDVSSLSCYNTCIGFIYVDASSR